MLLEHKLESGFECSDPDCFHSSITGGFRNVALVDPHDEQRRILQLEHGRIAYTRRESESALDYEIEVLDPALVYDLVCRWVFSGRVASEGRIGGELVPRGSLLYHQHACSSCTLGDARISLRGAATIPASMEAHMYLRCEASERDPTGYVWIVHARALAKNDQSLWLKHSDGHAVPFRGHPVEAHVLHRRRERAAPIYPTQIQAHAQLEAGVSCRIGLEVAPAFSTSR